MKLAVMGCVVNGPGESQARQHRHLAARNLRGTESPRLRRRQLSVTLKGDTIVADFKRILDDYVASHYGSGKPKEPALTAH